MRLIANGKYAILGEGKDNETTWPTPMDGMGDEDSIEWILRYGTAERVLKARFLAASIVDAYRELIRLPIGRRNEIIRGLRAAITAQQADHPFDVECAGRGCQLCNRKFVEFGQRSQSDGVTK